MNGRGDLAALRRQVNGELLDTDTLMGQLEHRVIELERVAATRWPARILARARLGRSIRRSVRHFPGETFAERRISAATNEWLRGNERRARRWAR